MPIPELDPETGCLPAEPRLHECTVEEMRQRFVDGMPARRRGLIYETYRWHTAAWTRIVASRLEQWIGGSFVTAKPEPRDIDFVTFVPTALLQEISVADRHDLDELFMGPDTPSDHLLHAFRVATYPMSPPEAVGG